MYKVFINEKPVILTGEVPGDINRRGIRIYSYRGLSELKQVIETFDQDDETSKLVIINSNNPDLLRGDFESLYTPVHAAGGIVYHPDKGMLWILRRGRWDLPKGKIDPQESPEHAAMREVEEETGIGAIRITAPLETTYHVYREKGKTILKISRWFAMETGEPDALLRPQENEGISGVEWTGAEGIEEKISSTWANLRELALHFVAKYTPWKIRYQSD